MIKFIKQLFSLNAETSHRKRAGFRLLDVEEEAAKMRLEHHGRKDGARDVPPADATRPGTVESEIMALGKNMLQENVQYYEQEHQSYTARLAALTPQGMLSDARLQTQGHLASMAQLPQRHSAHLGQLRDKVASAQKELRLFRHDNGLEEREARYPESKVLQWGIMMILLVIESFLNATFLAQGNELGLLGGWTEAIVISLLNAVLLGSLLFWGYRLCTCYQTSRKLLGLVTLLLVAAAAVAFNLFVAHYRNAIGGEFPEQAGAIAWNTFLADPWNLGDFKSVMLLMLGLLIVGVAALDWSFMDETYPNYGHITRKSVEARGELAEFHHWLVHEELQGLRDTTDNIISRHLTHAAEAAGEDARVLSRMKVLNDRMMESVDNIQSGVNRLLHLYREANKASRETDTPEYFSSDWKYGREIQPHPLPPAREMPPVDEFIAVLEPLQQELSRTYNESLRILNEMNE